MQQGETFGKVPDISFMDFLFGGFEETSSYKDRPWIVDVPSGRSVTFGQVKEDAVKIASGLARLGFRQGDVLYFVTYEAARLFLVKIGVWMLGGVVRGCSQNELPDDYARQIKESAVKFVLVDSETIQVIQPALDILKYDGCIISLDDEPIPGTTHISKLLADDGSALKLPTKTNPKEDPLVILNTSGSTGNPKGVVHTHYSIVENMKSLRNIPNEDTVLEFMINYGVGFFTIALHYLNTGRTIYHINKFERGTYFDYLTTYKPRSILFYPHVANWFARCDDQLETLRDANIIKLMLVGGWVLDPTTADLLCGKLSNTHLMQVYGMTEIGNCTSTKIGQIKPLKLDRCTSEGQVVTSSGMFLPSYEGKIVGVDDKKRVGPHELGELYVRSPCIAKGYLMPGNKVQNLTDEEGWFQTGDLGIQDEKGNLFIKERARFMYKHRGDFVLPSEIEAVLLEHPDVQEAGVVGMPHPTTNSSSRAFVVIKKGGKRNEEELCKFISDRLHYSKHLHSGVRFVENLPVNRGGKLDRKALRQFALDNN
ncbi:Hypothetical predicted protein [Cloeon dipterum]|uniref:AMP-dependent synthetase/ligase domain-containing protein n=1 Tax=Cloeon dipterum TaxID=197152 RepID=A0A8S1C0N6_9INSE|nr:Hypothetical predicted protein [Cloeon dipterum]